MKKTILLCAMAIAVLGAQAQGKESQPKRGTFSFTPQVGVTWAKQTNVAAYKATEAAGFSATGYEPDARYNAGFTGGLEVAYQATTDWAFSLACSTPRRDPNTKTSRRRSLPKASSGPRW